MTLLLSREDPTLRVAAAKVLAVEPAGIVLDQTPFYARGGGQPGDSGVLIAGDGTSAPVQEACYAPDKATVLHPMTAADAAAFSPGDTVTAAIDWPKRHARMRIHTALHLLTTVLAYPVTGGAVGDGEGRLDFDMPDALGRETIEAALNAAIVQDHRVTARWISDDDLLANPGLVKTMSVKPPMGTGRVRLIAIGTVDLQPCGGTHVASTAEIGAVVVTGIEKKGRQNRRIRIALKA